MKTSYRSIQSPRHLHRLLNLSLLAAALLSGGSAKAATHVWANSNVAGGTPPTSLNWFNAPQATWTGGTPVSASDTVIQFFSNNTTQLGNTVPHTQASILDNGGTAFALETLTLTGRGSATAGANLTMNLSGDALNFSGATGTINLDAVNNGARSITYNVANNIQLGTASSGSALTFTGNGTSNFNFSGVLSELQAGGGSLIKNGTSTVTLSGTTNTFTGKTTINAGTLAVTQIGNIGGSGSLGQPTGSNAVISIGSGANAATLQYIGGGESTNRVIDLAGTTGTVTINNQGSGNLTFTSDLAVSGTGNKTLTFNNAINRTAEFSGIISDGAGSVISLAAGGNSGNITILSNDANSFTGDITLYGSTPTMTITSIKNTGFASAAGAGSVSSAINLGTSASASSASTLNYTGAGDSTNRTINLSATGTGTGIINNNGSNGGTGLILTGTIANQGTTKALQLGGSNTDANEVTSLLSNGTGTLSVSKLEVGSWRLSNNANSFTGDLGVNNGILTVTSIGASGVNSAAGAGSTVNVGGGGTAGILNYIGSGNTTNRALVLASTTTGGATINNNGSGALVFSGTVTNGTTNNSAKTFTLGGTNTAANVIQGNIANSASGGVLSLAKSDAGTWRLTGTNIYTGGTSINAGVLDAIDGIGLPTGSTLQMRGGVFQSSGTFSRTVGSASGNVNTGSFAVNPTGLGFAARGGVLNIQLDGGTGSLTWAASLSSFLNTGQSLVFGSSSADNLVDFQNGINLASSGTNTRTITVIDNPDSANDLARISGAITNTQPGQSLLKDGAGILQLTNTNTYTGTTTISGGTLMLGTGLTGQDGTISNSLSVVNNANLTYNRFGSNSYGGAISGSGSVTKTGVGTQTLTGTNTYQGATAINQGSLLVNGTHTGGGTYTVANGATLGGTGSTDSVVILSAGATISAGASIGTLNTGSEIWNGSAVLDLEMRTDGTGSAGTDWDLLAINGTLDLSGVTSSNKFSINLFTMSDTTTSGLLATWDPGIDHTWTGFLTTTGGITGIVGPLPDLFNVNTGGFQNSFSGTFSIAQSGNNLDLLYVIPEPSTGVLLAFGLFAALSRRRRRLVH